MTTPSFPVIPSGLTAQILHVERQFAAFEVASARRQNRLRAAQLTALLRHARARSPFWAERLPPIGADMRFEDLPVLTRADLQAHGEAMCCAGPMPGGDRLETFRTSGSSGRPVEVVKNNMLHGILYAAQQMRSHRWHGLDTRRDVAIMSSLRDGDSPTPWGKVSAELGGTGKGYIRSGINHSPEDLWAWLRTQEAPYLVATPTLALKLARLALDDACHGRRLDAVLTYSEVVTPELRAAVRDAFGARVIDRYSSEEVGWIAVQCPRHDHLHVMSSTVHAEIVGDDNRPVAPGEEGRVLVTPLHAYAMPLVRYELGDRAVAGGACDCGLRLPVISRVLGRERSYIILPDGTSRLAQTTGEYWREIAPVDEYRVLQYADGILEAFVTAPRPLSEEELANLRAMLRQRLHPDLEVHVTQQERIEWPSRWKRIDVMRVDYRRDERPGG